MDVVTEFVGDGVLSELLYADDLVLPSEALLLLKNKCIK